VNPFELAERIRAARLAVGITQYDAAQRLGLPRARIAEWESRRVVPKISALVQLVTVLGYSPRILLPELFEPRPLIPRTPIYEEDGRTGPRDTDGTRYVARKKRRKKIPRPS
jgi:transcriptional regulator with XRE-family HTH domain